MEAVGLILLLLMIGLYFLPTIIAMSGKKRNTPAIAMLNLLLGWTLIGWAIAMVWAFTYEAPDYINKR